MVVFFLYAETAALAVMNTQKRRKTSNQQRPVKPTRKVHIGRKMQVGEGGSF